MINTQNKSITQAQNASGLFFASPGIESSQDYEPFGSLLPGRNWNSENYKHGFNGQLKSDEIAGSGNHYTAEFWEYDSRLGRRWNMDPVIFPEQSPYSCFNNNPLYFADPYGLSPDDGSPKHTKQWWQFWKHGPERVPRNISTQTRTQTFRSPVIVPDPLKILTQGFSNFSYNMFTNISARFQQWIIDAMNTTASNVNAILTTTIQFTIFMDGREITTIDPRSTFEFSINGSPNAFITQSGQSGNAPPDPFGNVMVNTIFTILNPASLGGAIILNVPINWRYRITSTLTTNRNYQTVPRLNPPIKDIGLTRDVARRAREASKGYQPGQVGVAYRVWYNGGPPPWTANGHWFKKRDPLVNKGKTRF